MRKWTTLLVIIFTFTVLTGCGQKVSSSTTGGSAQSVKKATIEPLTSKERKEVENIARAMAKKAGEGNPTEINIEPKIEESSKTPFLEVTVKGSMQDAWSGTGRYGDELFFSILRKDKKVFFIGGTNDGQLLWQKGFAPVTWRLVSQ